MRTGTGSTDERSAANILIVGDDPDIGNLIEEVLRAEGHDAVRAYLMPTSVDGSEQFLKQRMSNLRRKVQEAGASDCIEAICGVGFRLAVRS